MRGYCSYFVRKFITEVEKLKCETGTVGWLAVSVSADVNSKERAAGLIGLLFPLAPPDLVATHTPKSRQTFGSTRPSSAISEGTLNLLGNSPLLLEKTLSSVSSKLENTSMGSTLSLAQLIYRSPCLP